MIPPKFRRPNLNAISMTWLYFLGHYHKPRLKKDSYELWFTNNYHFQEPYQNLTYSKPKFEPHLKTQPTNKTKSSALQMFIQMRKSKSRGALHRTAKTIISAAAAEFESVTQHQQQRNATAADNRAHLAS